MLAAIAFHFAGYSETIALVAAGVFALAGALASLSRLRVQAPSSKPRERPAPGANQTSTN